MWSHLNPGAPAVFQMATVAPAATNLSAHTSAVTVIGNSVSGQVTVTSDGTGGDTGVICRIPFADLVAGGIYSVTLTSDSAAGNDTTGVARSAGIFVNSGVASLYINLSTGMAASKKQVWSYHVERVG